MPNQKMKSENYSNLGGINNKVSPHLNTPLEFLDIVNFDFQTPGCLTSRWGSTTIFTTGTSGQLPGRILSLYNYVKSDGSTKVIASGAGANGISGFIFAGSDYTSAMTGLSLTNLNETLVFNWPAWQFYIGNDSQFNGYRPDGVRLIGGTLNGPGFSATFSIQPTAGNTGNAMSWVSYNDWAFGADGNKFIKYNGSSVYSVGVPPGIGGATRFINSNNSNTLGFGNSGGWGIYASYVNCRGVQGEIWPIAVINNGANGLSLGASLYGALAWIQTPLQYGITSVNIYSYFNGGTFLGSVSGVGSNVAEFGSSIWSMPYRFIKNVPVSGSTFLTFNLGSTVGGQTFLMNNLGTLPEQTYSWPGGMTFIKNTDNYNVYQEVKMMSFLPNILEIHKDRLYAAGFSSSPRTTFYSDVGEPEGFLPENQFELSSQDGEPITAMKSFRGQLYIFTRNSVHALSGDNANNFSLTEITREYGCINKFCVTQFNNVLAFLSRRGLIAFNGANFDNISEKIQPEFDSIQANENCRIVNDQTRKQIICAIASNITGVGSSTVSRYPVYDYSVNSWTRYSTQGRYDALAEASGPNGLPERSVIYGSGNLLLAFGSSLKSDGTEGGSLGFTLGFKTRFLHDIGDSSQKMFRRLYLNTIGMGSTQSFISNFYQDYGSSVVYSATMYLGGFQDRIDFGISAKSMAFEYLRRSNAATLLPITVSGFTIESRKLRDV